MTTRPSVFSGLFLCALSLSACGGGDGAALRFGVTEHPVTTSQALVQGATADTQAAPTFQSSDGLTFTLSQARIHLRDIRLDLPKGTKCADVIGQTSGVQCKGSDDAAGDDSGSGSGTLVVAGPIVVDLMAGTTTPDLSGLRVPAGSYKRIDFRLEEAKSDEVAANEPLIGYSLIARAGFQQDGQARTLELLLKFSEDARFETATGVEVPEGGTLVAMLKPEAWLKNLPVATCLQKGDVYFENSTLRIDDRAKGDCSGAESTVKNNIKTSGDLRKVED